jgi:glutathione S-transferase
VVAFGGNLSALWNFAIPAICSKLSPRGEEYFRRTREKSFGKAMEDIVPKGEVAVAEWAKFKDGMGKVDAWYAKNGGKGLFLLGETPSWGDIVIVSYLVWMKIVWGEDSQQWKDISSWNNGRWAGLVEALQDYETVV